MIDTNAIANAAQTIQTVKTNFAQYGPLLAVAAAWITRELHNMVDAGGLVGVIRTLLCGRAQPNPLSIPAEPPKPSSEPKP